MRWVLAPEFTRGSRTSRGSDSAPVRRALPADETGVGPETADPCILMGARYFVLDPFDEREMRLALLTALLAAPVFLLLAAPTQAGEREPDPYVLEVDFAYPNIAGDTIRLSDERFRGKVVMLDLFGTWCGPCHNQAPQLSKWYETYRDQGFEIIGIAYERSAPDQVNDRLASYIEKYGLEYEVIYAGKPSDARKLVPQLSHLLGRFPTTILVERSGALEGIEFGYNPMLDEDMEMSIERLLEHPLPIFPEETESQPPASASAESSE